MSSRPALLSSLAMLLSACNSGQAATTTSAPAPSASSSANPGLDLAPLEELTHQKARAPMKARGCPSASASVGPGAAFALQCKATDGAEIHVELRRVESPAMRQFVLDVTTKDHVWVEHGDIVLAVAVRRDGKLVDAESNELLAAVVAAGAAEDPYAVVTPSGDTWLRPSLAQVGTKVEIAPPVVEDALAALQTHGYPKAQRLSWQGRDTADEKDTGIPNVMLGSLFGETTVKLMISCRENDSFPVKESDAAPGQAIWVTGRCKVVAEVSRAGAADKEASRALLAKLLDAPKPSR